MVREKFAANFRISQSQPRPPLLLELRREKVLEGALASVVVLKSINERKVENHAHLDILNPWIAPSLYIGSSK